MTEEDVTELHARCAAAWPSFTVGRDAFAAHLSAVRPENSPGDANAEDLYLACGCALGEARAIAAFDARYLPELPSYVGQIDRSPAFVDEVAQNLREKLFLPGAQGKRAKIYEYTGKGPLGAWLRVVSVRIALNLRRRPKATASAEGDGAPPLRAQAPDPEMDYLRLKYASEFRDAFQSTLTTLSNDERTVLKLHYIDGLNIDDIGKVYRVHRATVARWLSHAREKILDETKKKLEARLGMRNTEVESLLGMVQSQLDVSIHRFLKD